MPGHLQIARDEADDEVAVDAAHWLGQFYTDMDVYCSDTAIVLASVGRDTASLEGLWRAALANERLHRRAQPGRLEAMAALA